MDGLVYMVINQTSFSVQKKSAAQESARNAETTPPRCAAPPTPETPCCCESGAHRLSVENWKFGTMDLCGWFQFQQVIIISYPWKNSVNKELSSLTWRQTAAVWRNKRLIGGGCYTNPQPWGGRKAYLDTQCILSWSDASTKCKEPTPFSPELPWPMFVCPGQRCHWLFCRVADGVVSNVLKLEVFFFRSSFVRYAIWIISKKFSSNYHMLMPSPPSTTPCKGEDKAGWFGGQMDPVWGKQWTLWTLKPTKWEKKTVSTIIGLFYPVSSWRSTIPLQRMIGL